MGRRHQGAVPGGVRGLHGGGGIVQSRAIKEVLPFTLFEKTKDENPLVFDSFQSDKYDKRKELSKKDVVSEFLKGDLRFVNDVDGIL